MTEVIPAPEGYRVEPFGQDGGPTADDVLAMWVREPGLLDPEVAARRVHEALIVAIGPGEELAGVITTHLERSRQLHLPFWHLTTFVDRAHRKSYVGAVMLLRARDHLSEMHVSGQDRHGAGVMLEFHHHGLRTHLDMADRAGFAFIGQTRGGHNRWVGYFPGVVAPEPPGAVGSGAPEAAASVPAPPVAEGPVFVIAAPGSGGDAVCNALATSPELVVVDEPLLELGEDGRLEAADATDEVAAELRAQLSTTAGDRRPLVHGVHDALRVPFLHAVFPDATFVYLYREPGEAVPAALAGWESGDAVSVPDLRGWEGPPWSFALTPGWRSLRDSPLADVAAAQWEAATRIAVADLQRLAPERWSVVEHTALQADPGAELTRVATFAGAALEAVPELAEEAPPFAPVDLAAVLRRTADTAAVARTLFASGEEQAEGEAPAAPAGAVRSAGTESFTDVLAQIHASLLVSASEAGTVVTLRRAGESLNTHLAPIASPTGIAARGGRLAIGTPTGVASYRDMPMARNQLTGHIRRDSCFVPTTFRVTGDVGMGELAYAGDELWLVATRFSCLATLDDHHSFVPRWQPPFVSDLAAEDRCHLNGLCVVEDQVRFVTALGATDSPGGWRDGADGGGVVVDVRDGRTVASGLAMPCSPRWHRDRLWVLLAREGALATVDTDTGAVETVATVPGFARGLAFRDQLAFVGVSALRGAPEAERQTGVWVIELDTGATVAFLRFEAGVDQIADVQLLPATAFPEIVAADSDAARNAFLLP